MRSSRNPSGPRQAPPTTSRSDVHAAVFAARNTQPSAPYRQPSQSQPRAVSSSQASIQSERQYHYQDQPSPYNYQYAPQNDDFSSSRHGPPIASPYNPAHQQQWHNQQMRYGDSHAPVYSPHSNFSQPPVQMVSQEARNADTRYQGHDQLAAPQNITRSSSTSTWFVPSWSNGIVRISFS